MKKFYFIVMMLSWTGFTIAWIMSPSTSEVFSLSTKWGLSGLTLLLDYIVAMVFYLNERKREERSSIV